MKVFPSPTAHNGRKYSEAHYTYTGSIKKLVYSSAHYYEAGRWRASPLISAMNKSGIDTTSLIRIDLNAELTAQHLYKVRVQLSRLRLVVSIPLTGDAIVKGSGYLELFSLLSP